MGRCSKTIAETLSVSRRTVDSTIKRFKELGTLEDRLGRGRKTTATSTRNVKVVRDMVRRNPKRSMRKIAKKLGISHTSALRIVKKKLGLTPYRCRKVHLLTASMKKNRVQKCKMLLQRFTSARHRDIVFSDEKLFTLESTFNRQNDRVLCSTAEEANVSGRIHGRSGHAEKIMVWAAITYEAMSPLVFIDSDVKINTEVYSCWKTSCFPRHNVTSALDRSCSNKIEHRLIERR
uniref:HTH_Tnp_Tc3_2 domain-containing protein n=1 Tax=Haemonchus contortus TaxID=6289 RepID=A0A7I4YFT5_HAECO